MAKIITNDLKAKIMANVREKVRATYLKNEIGEELRQAENAVCSTIIEAVNEFCPPKSMAILKKYGSADTFGIIGVRKNKEGDVFAETSWSARRGGVTTASCKDLNFPVNNSRDKFLRELSEKKQPIFANFFNIADRIECEIGAIVSAYEARLKVGRGIKRLLEEYPGMSEFIPTAEAPKQPEPPKKTEMLISQFEKSISGEEVAA